MARLIDKGTREYTCVLIMMFFGSLAAFGAEYCLQPVIPILAQDFNLTPTQASLSMSFGTIGGTFLSNYGWSGIVVFETVILTIGLILAIILYKKKE